MQNAKRKMQNAKCKVKGLRRNYKMLTILDLLQSQSSSEILHSELKKHPSGCLFYYMITFSLVL